MDEKKLAASARAEYQREWRKKNPAKNKQYIMNYWVKKAQEAREAESKKGE